MTTCSSVPTNIAEIAGPLFVACVLNWMLFGVLCLQVYLYFEGYPHDRIYLKIMVYFVLAVETAQSVLFLDSVFYSLARGFGNMAALDRIGTIWFSVPFIDGLVAWIVQSFYGYRVYVLSRSKVLAMVIWFLSLLQFVAAVLTASAGSRAGTFSNLLKTDLLITNSMWEGGSALCDIVIAVTMTYALKTRDSGEIKTTHDFITRVIRLTIETGALTAVVSTISLILTFAPPGKTYYLPSVVVLGKLYSTTLMVLLNIRPRHHPEGTVCVCGNIVRGPSIRGGRGRALTEGACVGGVLGLGVGGVAIHKEVRKSVGADEVARMVPGAGRHTGCGGTRRARRGPVNVEEVMANRRKALYVPAEMGEWMSESSMDHASHMGRSLKLKEIDVKESYLSDEMGRTGACRV